MIPRVKSAARGDPQTLRTRQGQPSTGSRAVRGERERCQYGLPRVANNTAARGYRYGYAGVLGALRGDAEATIDVRDELPTRPCQPGREKNSAVRTSELVS